MGGYLSSGLHMDSHVMGHPPTLAEPYAMSFKRPKTNDWKQLRPFSHSELSDASAWMQSPTFFQEAG
eukprot:273894-Chlamydomonas_euryale.AAC.1